MAIIGIEQVQLDVSSSLVGDVIAIDRHGKLDPLLLNGEAEKEAINSWRDALPALPPRDLQYRFASD
jgi:hypothetical protein